MPQMPFTFRDGGRGRPRRDPPGGSGDGPGRAITVSELNARLRGTVERQFGRVWVEGELRGITVHARSGHAYFDLADPQSLVPVFMARSVVNGLGFRLQEGMQVLIEASASVYAPRGRLQLQARRLEAVGEGARLLAFRELVARLEREGLLAPERKRPLPPAPRLVGVVSSKDGAALRDVLRTATRRHPGISLLLAPAPVQGPAAPEGIARALARIDRAGCDVVLLVRGGGSLEDLHAFNDERVARAVAACRTPVVSGVGHETDTTAADLVADARASTPTAAAELAVPEAAAHVRALRELSTRLQRAMRARLAHAERDLRRLEARTPSARERLLREAQRLDELDQRAARAATTELERRRRVLWALERRLAASNPVARAVAWRSRLEGLRGRIETAMAQRVRSKRRALELGLQQSGRELPARLRRAGQTLDGLQERLHVGMRRSLEAGRRDLVEGAARLEAVSPLAVLARGYAVVRTTDGRAVRDATEVSSGDRIQVRVRSGHFDAEVC